MVIVSTKGRQSKRQTVITKLLPLLSQTNSFLQSISLCAKKNLIPMSIEFSIITLLIYRQILKKYRKGAKTLFLNSHIRSNMLKFESSMFNSAARKVKTYIHTHPDTAELR